MERELFLKHALQNALNYGKANPKAILARVLAEKPEWRRRIPEAERIAAEIAEEVNALSAEEREKRAGKFEFFQKEVREGLPPLENAVEGKVVTRFAPAPTGPLNVLHLLRAVMINWMYARQYKGKFVLRLEDTDPKVVEEGFYKMIQEDLKAVGVKWDEFYIMSDFMDLYYQKAEGLLEKGKIYVCTCPAEEFKKLKEGGRDCECRANRLDKNLRRWHLMISGHYTEGKAVVRFKTSMSEANPALRDPPILRISEAAHPLKGKKYRVWPLYNFANVIMDNKGGVTHAFRGKEHEVNSEIQKRIFKELGMKQPVTVNFGMMYLPGEKLHTRDIKQGIREGKYSGWDDLRLYTVRAFLRRGFQPEALRKFSEICGLSKTDIRIDIGNLEAINRKLLDSRANRYMAVLKPEEVDISSMVRKGMGDYVHVKNHPEREDTRKVAVSGRLYVSGEDFRKFKGQEVRLMDLFNVVLDTKARLAKNQEFDMKTPKIQWVAERNVKLDVLFPDRVEKALGEEAIGRLGEGEIIQMIRIGFGRVEKQGTVVFAHK